MGVLLRPLQLAALAGIAIAVPAGVWLLWNFDPNAADSRFPPCMFHALTGLFCIGCGLTRALHALVHGDLAGALSMNPLGVLVLPVIPMIIAHSRGWRPRWLEPAMKILAQPKFWLVLLPVYWIARNLPWFPFTLLAPG
ncbi:MAG: DUF2752 domain-containing protein [Lysobacteraceae bacterium]|nr:MAG: DUF2752 domain-containing protein [Xanthomonadaceae bacterium]